MKREAPEGAPGIASCPHDPNHSLVKHVVDALALEEDDLLVDLRCGDGAFAEEILRQVRLTWQIIAVEAAPEHIVEGALSTNIRPVAMHAETFARFPIRYHKALLRDGFSSLQQCEGALERIFHQLIPGGRILVVESTPTPDLPLFPAALELWRGRRLAAQEIARRLDQVGFTTRVQSVDCDCRAPVSECLAWVKERRWPVLEDLPDGELARGLAELRRRTAGEQEVTWTARFDLVTGIKEPGPAA